MSDSNTRISYVHGVSRIPSYDVAGRGGILRAPEYIPFSKLSKGQFDLMVQLNMARAYADYSGDATYAQAENMLTRALRGDTSNTGYISEQLYPVAQVIKQSARNVFPVAQVSGPFDASQDCKYWVVQKMLTDNFSKVQARYGPGAGQTRFQQLTSSKQYAVIYDEILMNRNVYSANANAELRKLIIVQTGQYTSSDGPYLAECKGIQEVEKIYNKHLPDAAHHSVYNVIDKNWTAIPNRLDTKRILHGASIIGLANAGTVDQDSFRTWVNGMVTVKNLKSDAPATLTETAFAFDQSGKWVEAYKKAVPGVNGIGAPTKAILDKIILITSAAVAVAGLIAKGIADVKKSGALASAKDYGSTQFGPDASDFPNVPPGGTPPSGGLGIDTNTLLLVGGAAATYFLLNDKK